ncbi:type I restriction-modification enzyme R subunit C-terminal domain-containing protein [Streptomyces globisporus]|uniref:type I restriction-modification enzyme R subunit C-terminal domain-containing protein n=1 Tax=Streptomyces globisporus TaxID=1908 RepID=UPI0004CBF3F8|nr:type I restriction-modification enzyme R subunit C-terminal domain-containing protein [Streptomyces globisporus]
MKDDGGSLGLFVRSLCGLDRRAAQQAFESFITGKQLSARQLDFITLIIDVVVRRGLIVVPDLYEAPFTDRAPNGPEDLFANEEIVALEVVFRDLQDRARPTALAA